MQFYHVVSWLNYNQFYSSINPDTSESVIIVLTQQSWTLKRESHYYILYNYCVRPGRGSSRQLKQTQFHLLIMMSNFTKFWSVEIFHRFCFKLFLISKLLLKKIFHVFASMFSASRLLQRRRKRLYMKRHKLWIH